MGLNVYFIMFCYLFCGLSSEIIAQKHVQKPQHAANINKCGHMGAYRFHAHYHYRYHCEHLHIDDSEHPSIGHYEKKVDTVRIAKHLHKDTASHAKVSEKLSVNTPTIETPVKDSPKFLPTHKLDSIAKLTDEQKANALDKEKPAIKLPPINFLHNQDDFSVVNMDAFMEAAEYAKQGHMVLVEGHTDDRGNDDYNLNLSLKRAKKIRQLMLDLGVRADRIAIMGCGERRPIVPNDTDENRNLNRRIEFIIY